MTLATKNGSLIVKDGKLAENCGCCGGWYCYNECPCNYLGLLPDTLNASLSLTIPETIYGTIFGDFTGAVVSTTRITASNAASVGGSYVMTRLQGLAYAGGCFYEYRSSGLAGGETVIRVQVGGGSRVGFWQVPPESNSCEGQATSVTLSELSFSVPAKYASAGYAGAINTFCSGIPTYWSNAASRTYDADNFVTFPGSPQSVTCGAATYSAYLLSLVADWSSGNAEIPPCDATPVSQIDRQWRIGVRYTNTAGESPVVTTVANAVTLRVFE